MSAAEHLVNRDEARFEGEPTVTEAVTKTIVGTCQEIEQKPGSEWVKFKIDVGSKYPVALSTKVEKIIEEARAVGGETATWTFKERESEQLNENTGKPFVNRYLDKVELGEHAPDTSNTGSTPAPQRAVQGAYDMISQGDKDRAISRMSCLSSAATLLQGVDFETEAARITAWLAAAAAAEARVYRNITDLDDIDDGIPF